MLGSGENGEDKRGLRREKVSGSIYVVLIMN